MTTVLTSWNNGSVREAIVDFVAAVCDPAGRDYVLPVERIAAFDIDGTLWCEQPLAVQIAGAIDFLAAKAVREPAKRARQPYKAAAEGDMAWFAQYLTNVKAPELIAMLLEAGAGETHQEFEKRANAWLATARHPRFDRLYKATVYRPMIELMDYLRRHEFKVFVCSGSGMDFMRLIAEETFGVPREYVVGSNMRLSWEQRDGKPMLVRQAGLVEPFNDGPGKPITFQLHVGRSPILVGGNSDGDVALMEFAAASGRTYLNLLVCHDDAEREYDYTRSAEKARVAAAGNGWITVSMKDDWRTIFE